MLNKWRLIFSIVCIVLQLIYVATAYFEWKKDCKTISKEYLAVSLLERI